jgi:hypothetical protein
MTATSEFYAALKSKAGIIPAEEVKVGNQLKILARLQPGKMASWRAAIGQLRSAEFQCSWTLDISKLFFLKNNNPKGSLVHAWRIILKSDNLDRALNEVTKIIKSTPNVRVEIGEIELPGGGYHRNIESTSGAKGANFTSGTRESTPWLRR